MIYNKEAEQALISGVLRSPTDKPLDVRADDFYLHDHQLVWAEIMKQDEPDVITVTDACDIQPWKITEILSVDAPFWKIGDYAKIVKEDSAKRKMNWIAGDIATKVANGEEVNEVIAFGIRELDRLSSVSGKGRALAAAASDAMDGILENIEKLHNREKIDYGLDPGIPKIRSLFKGFKNWLVYLAGPPGVGKSMLALQWALVFAKQKPGDYVALEMGSGRLY